MQDLRDGTMAPIDPEILEKYGAGAAGEAVGIPKVHQGPVFKVGQEIEVLGGKFRIQSFGSTHLVLKSLPGTHIRER